MNNKEFITELSDRTSMDGERVQTIVDDLVKIMLDSLQDGQIVTAPGFGSFEVKKKMERIIVSPITQQRMLVPPKLTMAFKPSTILKDKIK